MGSKESSSYKEGLPNRGEIKDHPQRLEEALRDFERGREPPALFEMRLHLEDLLPRLEQARVIPKIENPNPYDTSEEMDQHEQWWEDHPQESETFLRQVDQRNQRLGILYIGTLIGRGPWNVP